MSKPKLYRKKPVVIEAMLFDGSNGMEVYDWISRHGGSVSARGYDKTVVIDTLEGEMTANAGDYVIKGVKGEFYPCKPDIFAATYEEVEDDR